MRPLSDSKGSFLFPLQDPMTSPGRVTFGSGNARKTEAARHMTQNRTFQENSNYSHRDRDRMFLTNHERASFENEALHIICRISE